MSNDIFCQIIDRTEKAYILYENNNALAFLDIDPYSTGHAIIVPKRHVTKICDLNNNEIIDVFSIVQRISKVLEENFRYEGIVLLANSGELLQDIKHLHFHLYGKTVNEKPNLPKNTELESIQKIISSLLTGQSSI